MKQHRVFSPGAILNTRRLAWCFGLFIVLKSALELALSVLAGGLTLGLGIFVDALIPLGFLWLFVWSQEIGASLKHETDMTI